MFLCQQMHGLLAYSLKDTLDPKWLKLNQSQYVHLIAGNVNICLTWKNYFKDLYNCLPSSNSATEFYNKLNLHQINCHKHSFIAVNEVKDALNSKRKIKVLV